MFGSGQSSAGALKLSKNKRLRQIPIKEKKCIYYFVVVVGPPIYLCTATKPRSCDRMIGKIG